MKSKVSAMALVILLTIFAALPGAAAPAHSAVLRGLNASPCVPGGGYNPACDADQNGQINVTDIQLTADHWNQSGVWLSDNNHDHYGQTWTGADNPLVLQGSFGPPSWAPLSLSNSIGAGLRVNTQGGSGVWVESALIHGVLVDSAGADGVFVCRAGNTSACTPSSQNNGVEIGRAENHGVRVNEPGADGLFVFAAGDDGVDVQGNDLAGFFMGAIGVTGGCTGCLLATFGVNMGDTPLAPGDLVALAGLRASGVDSVPMLMEVASAGELEELGGTRGTGGTAVVGVVQGWAELVTEEEPRPTEIGLRLVPRKGAADPGQYVTIAYSGLTQVKASGPIAQGSKLAAGTDGAARALRTVTVDGVELAENASAIGIALEPLAAVDGRIWVLVNVQ